MYSILSDYNIKHLYSIQQHDVNDLKKLSETKTILNIDLNDPDSMLKACGQSNIEFDIIGNGNFTHILYWFELINMNECDKNVQNSIIFKQFAAFSVTDKKLTIDSADYTQIKIISFFKNSLLHLKFDRFN